ncbi:LVIVD repeat-containing protein [Neolewinella antarctica]|uniref:LVIVD repeat-containing protein n=1 Tax=Neolewinella antarctica TaxID=442734 RepID=A0ABX0X7D3_9BACT|nr:hypothetical protein [Neolewinella antarctica]NJC25057.1 hypothetical protein [Neolewinella antarctica]
MRTLSFTLFTLLFALTLTSCIEETCEDTIIFQGFEPQIVTTENWRGASFGCFGPIDVCEATGFYVYQQYLFMVEDGKGLHIIDNSDPHNPLPVTWMEVPGGQGLAVRNNILYMNQYTDLVAFDLADPKTPTFISRTENVFEPYTVFASVLDNGQFVSNWIATDEERVVDCNSPNNGPQVFLDNTTWFAADFSAINNAFAGTAAPTTGGETVGRGGSLARFTITQSTLYAVDDSQLKAFSLADERNPEYVQNIEIGFGIETIFPTADKLFIGSTTGMQIFSVADPLNPEHLSTFEHVLSCDPVVVSGDIAYVTLWGGRDCGSVGDQLEVIDVSDARNPVSLQITPMQSSHGLGVAEGKLFLCSQWDGFRTFDLTDEGLLGAELDHSEEVFARDVIVIPEQNNAIVLAYGQGGIQQFDYTDDGKLTATSHIAVCD